MTKWRKQESKLDEYVKTLADQYDINQAKQINFYNNIRHFYRKKWGCPLKIPNIQGLKLDLFELYDTVISYGGWQKVTSNERWLEVLQRLGIDENTQIAEYAIKLIYMRYLSKYEQNEYGGDSENDDGDLLGRSKLKGNMFHHAASAFAEAPVSTPKPALRPAEVADYEKVELALSSGLPNEIDFAINVITLLSHPGPYTLKLTEENRLISLLVAHCCVFDEEDGEPSNLKSLVSAWEEQLGYKFEDFWSNAGIRDDDMFALISTSSKVDPRLASSSKMEVDLVFNDDRLELQNKLNWRIFSILAIFRNLSFEECNKEALAFNIPLLKLLLLFCNSRWQSLVNSAFDTLSNISSQIDLSAPVDPIFYNHLFLKSITKALFSSDEFAVLRSLEILGELCEQSQNEAIISEYLDDAKLLRIFSLLTHKNILTCIVILESLWKLSELGKRTCDLLSNFNHSIDIFIKMLTVDAASVINGTTEQAGIKVVEVHGNGMTQPYTSKRSSLLQKNQFAEKPRTSAPASAENPTLSNVNSSVQEPCNSQPFSPLVADATLSNDYMCEWNCCGKCFPSADSILQHNSACHLVHEECHMDEPTDVVEGNPTPTILPAEGPAELLFVCKWSLCNDAIKRPKWSMVSHLQERHCNDAYLQIALRKRREVGVHSYLNQMKLRLDKPKENAIVTPGYSKFAAVEAIRRHTLSYMARELSDDAEGPVTKSIRLTTALILRNIAKFSTSGRSLLQKYESQLSLIALSRSESSVILCQCLYELSKQCKHSAEKDKDSKS